MNATYTTKTVTEANSTGISLDLHTQLFRREIKNKTRQKKTDNVLGNQIVQTVWKEGAGNTSFPTDDEYTVIFLHGCT